MNMDIFQIADLAIKPLQDTFFLQYFFFPRVQGVWITPCNPITEALSHIYTAVMAGKDVGTQDYPAGGLRER